MQIDLDLSDILDNVCDIKGNAPTTGLYGHTTQAAGVVIASGVACKLLPDTRRGLRPPGDKEAVVSKFILYLFPIDNVTLAENQWVIINSQRYNITEIIDPVVTGAPYEIRMERVKS